METRHWHIAHVIQHLSHGVKNVLTENKAGKFELNKSSSDSQQSSVYFILKFKKNLIKTLERLIN